MKLDRISDRSAYIVFGVALAASLVAAAFAPQDTRIGAWVRLVIWHGMLKWACIVAIYGMGVLAIGYLVTRRRALYDWARALQVATLPAWTFAVIVGAAAARLVWNSFNWTERRMTMSLLYIMVASIALIVGLVFEKPVLTSVLTVLTSLTMAAGLAWVTLVPDPNAVHPASAVMGAEDPAFRIFAFAMLGGCLVWVLALVVPVKHWLDRHAQDEQAEEAAGTTASRGVAAAAESEA